MAISPIRYQVAKRMKTALASMTVAGGYHYETTADHVTLDPTVNLLTNRPIGKLPFFVIQPEVIGNRIYEPADQIKDELVMTIMVRQDVDPSYPDARLEALEKLAADLEKALAPRGDGSNWHGGLVIDARLDSPQPFIGVGSPVVVVVQTVRMPMRRGYGQPNMTV